MSNAKSILEKNESFKKRSLDEISIGVPYKKGQLTFIQKNNSELDVIKKGKKPLNINIKFTACSICFMSNIIYIG